MATLRERVVVHAYECVYEMARIGERERERGDRPGARQAEAQILPLGRGVALQ